MKTLPGQAFTEYALIGACVLGVAFMGLNSLRPIISVGFTNMLGGNPEKPIISSSGGGSPNGALTPNTQRLALKHQIPANGGMGLSTINFDTFSPQELIETVRTAGANGATNVLAQKLQSAAQQLRDDGKISETQFNGLIELANQGHKLASIALLIENAASQAKSAEDFKNAKVVVDSQSIAMADVESQVIGFNAPYWGEPQNLFDDPDGAGKELQNFIDLYKAAEADGTLQDPVIKELITSLSQDIISINEALDEARYKVVVEGKNPSEFNESTASRLTDFKSARICTTGNNTDTGKFCG